MNTESPSISKREKLLHSLASMPFYKRILERRPGPEKLSTTGKKIGRFAFGKFSPKVTTLDSGLHQKIVKDLTAIFKQQEAELSISEQGKIQNEKSFSEHSEVLLTQVLEDIFLPDDNEIFLASEFDDYINHTDAVIVFGGVEGYKSKKKQQQKNSWQIDRVASIDFAYSRAPNNLSQDELEERHNFLEKKVARKVQEFIKGYVGQIAYVVSGKKEPGNTEYFNALNVPHLIYVLNETTIEDLMQKKVDDIVLTKSEKTGIKREMIASFKQQLQFFIDVITQMTKNGLKKNDTAERMLQPLRFHLKKLNHEYPSAKVNGTYSDSAMQTLSEILQKENIPNIIKKAQDLQALSEERRKQRTEGKKTTSVTVSIPVEDGAVVEKLTSPENKEQLQQIFIADTAAIVPEYREQITIALKSLLYSRDKSHHTLALQILQKVFPNPLFLESLYKHITSVRKGEYRQENFAHAVLAQRIVHTVTNSIYNGYIPHTYNAVKILLTKSAENYEKEWANNTLRQTIAHSSSLGHILTHSARLSR